MSTIQVDRKTLVALLRWSAESLAQAPGFHAINDTERTAFGDVETYTAAVKLIREYADETWQTYLCDGPSPEGTDPRIVGYFDAPCVSDAEHNVTDCEHCGHLRCIDCAKAQPDFADANPATVAMLMNGDTCIECDKRL